MNPIRFADLTTLRVGGAIAQLIRARTTAELIAETSAADTAGATAVILGGGSNLLASDAVHERPVILVETTGVSVSRAAAEVTITVAAGENWDDLVQTAVASGWSGLEALSGIPGKVGGTPIQNVGAYGVEVAELLTGVRVWDRQAKKVIELPGAACGFGYRTSTFKRDPNRFVILEVTFRLVPSKESGPVKYAELARVLGVDVGAQVPTPRLREAVLGLRAAKGMVLAESDHDTWSAGSFFTNPILSEPQAADLPAAAPRYPVSGSAASAGVKTSAAWLIEQAGFAKGYGRGRAGVSTKHSLAITNRGGATAAEILALAQEIRAGVVAKFGIQLVPEPVFLGLDW